MSNANLAMTLWQRRSLRLASVIAIMLASLWAFEAVLIGTSMGLGGRSLAHGLAMVLLAVVAPLWAAIHFASRSAEAIDIGDPRKAFYNALMPWVVFVAAFLLLEAGL